MTLPSSCRAPMTPRGRPRASGGQRAATIARATGHQPAAAQALQRPAGDDDGEGVGGGGHHRAAREHGQAACEHRVGAHQVGQAADQGQHRGVAEEEAADDRSGALESVESNADTVHDGGQRHDHDVGVGCREQDGEAYQRQPPPVARTDHRHCVPRH